MTNSHDALSRLTDVLSSAKPSVVARAMQSLTSSLPTETVAPQPGQCWRLRWNDDVLLAVISRVDDDYLLAMPVDLSPDSADETAVTVPGDRAGFASDVAVFVMLETGVGSWTLEFFVGDLVGVDGASVLRGWLKGTVTDLPPSWRHGVQCSNDAHPRRIARQEIGERISTIGSADWLSPLWHRRVETTTTDNQPITPTYLALVATTLGGHVQRATAIARGVTTPTPDEQRLLDDADIRVYTAQPTPDVIRFLDAPAVKGVVLAVSPDGDEGRLRREVALASLAQVARATHQSDATLTPQVLLARDDLLRRVSQRQV